MPKVPPDLDLSLAHRYFAVTCFNDTWTLIEMPTRTSDEDEAMILCTMASMWHWAQRADVTDRNRSVGHWQISRVYSLVGQGENALRHGWRSLKFSEAIAPFFIGYAHEAIARAAAVLKDEALFHEHLKEAWTCSAKVAETDERELLEKDLRELQAKGC